MSFQDLTTIKGAAAARGIKFGMVANEYNLAVPAVADFIAAQSTILVGEEAMKMVFMQPTQGVFDFTKSDQIASYATARGLALRFHTLIWHAALPTWAPAAIAANWQSVMDAHIAGVAGRYPQAVSCDVANEVIAENGLGWRTDSPWYVAAGSIDYVRRAFERAHIALPAGCKKFYCDFGMESGPQAVAKSAKLVELATILKADGHIDGIALQCHIPIASNAGPLVQSANFASVLNALRGLGLEVNITELDIMRQTDAYDQALFRTVGAQAIKEILSIWLAAGVGRELLVWCIKDDLSWTHAAFPSWTQYPGAHNSAYTRNPLFYAIRSALIGH